MEHLHCKELSHLKVSFFANQVKGLRILLFGAVSKKKTIGDYKDKISGQSQAEDYYNKCAQYLLERVGEFMSHHEIESSCMSVVFEKKRHDYGRLRRYIHAIRRKPLDGRARFLARIDPLSITAKDKKEEDLLSLSDLTAYSLYQFLNESRSNYGIPEQRYFREIKGLFWRDRDTGVVANKGIKFIKGPIEMALKGETYRQVMKLYKPKA